MFSKKTNAMKKIILTYGLIAGAIVGILMAITMPLWKTGVITPDNGEYVGYTTMVIALSLVFFGMKAVRDNQGSLSFGQGVKAGLLITLIAGIMYAIAWEICYNTIMSDFVSMYSQHYINGLKAKGESESEISEATQKMKDFAVLYANPFIRFGMTFAEILPVGILITLISAALLRRKEFLPSTN